MTRGGEAGNTVDEPWWHEGSGGGEAGNTGGVPYNIFVSSVDEEYGRQTILSEPPWIMDLGLGGEAGENVPQGFQQESVSYRVGGR